MIMKRYRDKNYKDERGNTPFDSIRLKRDERGNRPLDLAYKGEHWSVCQLLTRCNGFEFIMPY